MTLRGHVQAVYQVHSQTNTRQVLNTHWCQKVAWAADSRLLVSGSADSTLKLWSMETKKLHTDLPGHGDEVSTCFWNVVCWFCLWLSGLHSGLESWWAESSFWKQRSTAENMAEMKEQLFYSLTITNAELRHHHHFFKAMFSELCA